MKVRTIEEIHDREIGHNKFARFVDNAIKDGHTITEVKEFYEKFKFKMDNVPMEFDKSPKVNSSKQLEQCYKLLENYHRLEKLLEGK